MMERKAEVGYRDPSQMFYDVLDRVVLWIGESQRIINGLKGELRMGQKEQLERSS